MTRLLIALVIISHIASAVAGSQRRTGSITGRVTGDSGQPLANAQVFVRGGSPIVSAGSSQLTDEDGRFHADDLRPGLYFVVVNLTGFVPASDSPDREYHRIGDSVNIQMAKGGVITGTVTTQTGEPVVAARAVAMRVRDTQGHPVRTSAGGNAWTDDRGNYRVYGLQAGYYLVSINGGQFYYPGYAYNGDVPVYHPSSTRDTAKEVSVQTGQEVAGIDIRYRGERGHAITGIFTGLPATDQGGNTAVLMNFASSSFYGVSSNSSRENNRSFAFYGVPDGDYQLIAQSFGVEKESASALRRVTMKGADITGIELQLAPLGSVAGRVTLETLKEAELSPDCKDRRPRLVEETMLLIRRDSRSDKERAAGIFFPGTDGAPNEKGDFAIGRLIAGRYNIEGRLPTEDWFIRSITLPGTARASAPLDAAKDGLTVTAGQRVTGLTIAAAQGAPAVRGKVVPAADGGSLPANLRVHMIPAERASTDDAVRFAEALVNNDGTFSLTNLAPGRYFIMAREIKDDEWVERSPRPIAWDTTARGVLRQEMGTTSAVVELRQCQRVVDYVVKYGAVRQPKAPISKKTGED